MMTKKIILTTLVVMFTTLAFAQKAERENIRKGNKEYRQQKYNTAESRYRDATKVNPHSKEAAYNLANTYYKEQNWDKAIKEYERFLTLEKTNPANASKAYHNLGNAYLRKFPSKDNNNKGEGESLNYLDKAIESYKQSLRINPNDEQTRYNLAVAQKIKQDQGGGGGGKNNKNNKDKNKNKNQDKNSQGNNQDKNKQNQQKQNDQNKQEQMSQGNADQILKAIEQDEKQTQQRVEQMKAAERKQKNENNKRNNKDW